MEEVYGANIRISQCYIFKWRYKNANVEIAEEQREMKSCALCFQKKTSLYFSKIATASICEVCGN
jgi:hypothetical protein